MDIVQGINDISWVQRCRAYYGGQGVTYLSRSMVIEPNGQRMSAVN